jgi:hypothetical protein
LPHTTDGVRSQAPFATISAEAAGAVRKDTDPSFI